MNPLQRNKVKPELDSIKQQENDLSMIEQHKAFIRAQHHLDSLQMIFDNQYSKADGNHLLVANLAVLQQTFNNHVTRYFLRWGGSDYLKLPTAEGQDNE